MPDTAQGGDQSAFVTEATDLAEALDAIRERMISADLPDDVIALWRTVAEHAWDAVSALEGDDE